ncbi:MAG: macro domain-containing protein, partial [Anaerolineales bacterium]
LHTDTMATLISNYTFPSGQTLELYHGDLTEEKVDAIVNAANESLAHGGGVAGAIVRRGGQEIQDESKRWVREHGLAGHDRPVLTGAGTLACKAVIHAVGPVWADGMHDEAAKLRTAYNAALEMAHEQGFVSLAFPSISTGIFGFPVQQGAGIAYQAVADFFAAHPASPLREVRFVLIDTPTVDVFKREFAKRDTNK